MSSTATRAFLTSLYDTAVAAAHPAQCLPAHLPPPPATGRIIVLAAGKAAGAMAQAAERHYLGENGFDRARLTGLAVARYGYEAALDVIEMVQAAHPVPDAAGVAATRRVMRLARGAGDDDLVLCLISGGGSANWIAPAPPLTLEEKQGITKALLRSGAPIDAINCLRKHLSQIKGGRLAELAMPARLLTLAISDVPRDDPSAIASGPTVPDPTTLADAKAVAKRYGVTLSPAARALLDDPAMESPKPGDAAFERARYQIVATPAASLQAVAERARGRGYEVVDLGADLQGEAREVAAEHAQKALSLRQVGRRAVMVSGGELTVTIRGAGRGGPNQEYALALALALEGAAGISALAGDTDGTDGGGGTASDPAGAFIEPTTLERMRALGRDPAEFLQDNDSTGFFELVGDLHRPGPTCTNVNDIRAIVVEPG